MAEYIRFTVPGTPIAQPRQRTRIVSGNGRQFAHNYTPATHPVNAWKATIRMAYLASGSPRNLDCPLLIRVTLIFQRPKNKIWKSRPMPREPKTGRPDCDNCIKALKDALTGIAWRDDALVYDERVSKWIADGTEEAHTVIEIEPMLGGHDDLGRKRTFDSGRGVFTVE